MDADVVSFRNALDVGVLESSDQRMEGLDDWETNNVHLGLHHNDRKGGRRGQTDNTSMVARR